MDITILSLIISGLAAIGTAIIGILSHIKFCRSCCCESDCTKQQTD